MPFNQQKRRLEGDFRRDLATTSLEGSQIYGFEMAEKAVPKQPFSNYLAMANFGTSILGILFFTLLLIRRLLSTICLKKICCNCCKMSKKTSVMEQAKLAKKVDKHDNDLVDDIIEMLRVKTKLNMQNAMKKNEAPVELIDEQDMILETEERELL